MALMTHMFNWGGGSGKLLTDFVTYTDSSPRSVILNASVLRLGWSSGPQILAVNSSGTAISNESASSAGINFKFIGSTGSAPRLMNIAEPQYYTDAATKQYVDRSFNNLEESLCDRTDPLPICIDELVGQDYEQYSKISNSTNYEYLFDAWENDDNYDINYYTGYWRLIPYTTIEIPNSSDSSVNSFIYYKITGISYEIIDGYTNAFVTFTRLSTQSNYLSYTIQIKKVGSSYYVMNHEVLQYRNNAVLASDLSYTLSIPSTYLMFNQCHANCSICTSNGAVLSHTGAHTLIFPNYSYIYIFTR